MAIIKTALISAFILQANLGFAAGARPQQICDNTKLGNPNGTPEGKVIPLPAFSADAAIESLQVVNPIATGMTNLYAGNSIELYHTLAHPAYDSSCDFILKVSTGAEPLTIPAGPMKVTGVALSVRYDGQFFSHFDTTYLLTISLDDPLMASLSCVLGAGQDVIYTAGDIKDAVVQTLNPTMGGEGWRDAVRVQWPPQPAACTGTSQ